MNNFDRDDILYASSLHRYEQSYGTKPLLEHVKSTPSSKITTKKSLSIANRSEDPSHPPRSRIPRPKPKKVDYTLNSRIFTTAPTVQPSGAPYSSKVALPNGPQPPPSRPIKKSTIPSISDIVRAHAVDLTPSKSLDSRDSLDLISRSSIDTIAEEVQHTLRQPLPDIHPPRSLESSNEAIGASSPNDGPPLPHRLSTGTAGTEIPQSEAIATYVRSARLTKLVKVPRPLRAPLQVSLSDLGNPDGRPLVVFLGLGAVRYIMGLYDEMAEILGLRIITIDRWGLGRTTQDTPDNRGVQEWGRIVNDILDRLNVQKCSILAHSAGAPYAMSFASAYPDRVKGDICLLAPWVGGSESSGYKWLKYVPNGLLKTAHAAEWRIQTWMLGKPPSMNYQGIGFNKREQSSEGPPRGSSRIGSTSYFDSRVQPQRKKSSKSSITKSDRSSILSNDYDDLADFEGCFESRSTLTTVPSSPVSPSNWSADTDSRQRRTSRGLFQALLPRTSGNRRDSADSRLSSSNVNLHGIRTPKLKSLRSISSLRNTSKNTVLPPACSKADPPALPSVGLGLGGFDWPKLEPSFSPSNVIATSGFVAPSRSRRSISLNTQSSSHKTPPLQRANKSQLDVNSDGTLSRSNNALDFQTSLANASNFQASLANALVAASHAEASKGVHSDLLQILNHDGKPWGFSYSSYPHKLRVWYGGKDERIAEGAVRWMERTMGVERCEVKVVQNADHSLIYKPVVIVEVMEIVRSFWD